MKDRSQFFVTGKWKPEKRCKSVKIDQKSDLALTLIVNISGYKQYFWDLSKVEVRVFVAGAVEKGPGSFWQMGAKLLLLKVGMLHFVALDAIQS